MESGRPFTIVRIDHILLLVEGMSDALAFYEGALGCAVESRLPHYGMVELRAGSSHIDLVDVAAPEGAWAKPDVAGGRNADHIALRLRGSDETALRQHLTACGIPIADERREDNGNVSLYVRDPSGNTIELIVVKAGAVA
jgi:glyoxylase I family protein